MNFILLVIISSLVADFASSQTTGSNFGWFLATLKKSDGVVFDSVWLKVDKDRNKYVSAYANQDFSNNVLRAPGSVDHIETNLGINGPNDVVFDTRDMNCAFTKYGIVYSLNGKNVGIYRNPTNGQCIFSALGQNIRGFVTFVPENTNKPTRAPTTPPIRYSFAVYMKTSDGKLFDSIRLEFDPKNYVYTGLLPRNEQDILYAPNTQKLIYFVDGKEIDKGFNDVTVVDSDEYCPFTKYGILIRRKGQDYFLYKDFRTGNCKFYSKIIGGYVETQFTRAPTLSPTKNPIKIPTKSPSFVPTRYPTRSPTKSPTKTPTHFPINIVVPTRSPTKSPTKTPTHFPINIVVPTRSPTKSPTKTPTHFPINIAQTVVPTKSPSRVPTSVFTMAPSKTKSPTFKPTQSSTFASTSLPTSTPTSAPTMLSTLSSTTSESTYPNILRLYFNDEMNGYLPIEYSLSNGIFTAVYYQPDELTSTDILDLSDTLSYDVPSRTLPVRNSVIFDASFLSCPVESNSGISINLENTHILIYREDNECKCITSEGLQGDASFIFQLLATLPPVKEIMRDIYLYKSGHENGPADVVLVATIIEGIFTRIVDTNDINDTNILDEPDSHFYNNISNSIVFDSSSFGCPVTTDGISIAIFNTHIRIYPDSNGYCVYEGEDGSIGTVAFDFHINGDNPINIIHDDIPLNVNDDLGGTTNDDVENVDNDDNDDNDDDVFQGA